ncbi:ABC transporter permease [Nonomuraea glycinis]|uniref:Transport permease protein n=1 Tax=Nonomuraea glycinis TaxID=2047744 RepID=A0A918E9P8_9ACTN|nr:ABC transporter permease [Nonomuraea glycinis]MCA2182764.1 ABC transporter permease [Nonomuraea glycinis]WSG71157.1 ABC transporter permease [Nonomuraea glycinis]GGP17238.1 transport permease protein [Nonomuraea glycinis]
MTTFLHDTTTIFRREFVPVVREPLGLVFEMGQPLLFLFLFGSLLDGAVGASWQWFVPGILVMMCLTGPLSSGYNLLVELIGGSMERLMVTPVDRTALLIGRALKEMTILFAQAVLIIVLALPLGFELHLAGAVAGVALLVVFGVGLGSLSFVLAMRSAPSGELFYVVTQGLLFPLLLLSGVLLPTDSGPAWLRVVGDVNPVTYIVEAQRALFAGDLTDVSVLYGAAMSFAVAALGLWLGNRAMRRGV